MTLRLENKNIVLIGAGQTKGESIGIGRATALLFAREGANLLLVDRYRSAAEETLAMIEDEGGSARVHQADITSADACAGLVNTARAELGGIDVLFNGVGIHGPGLVADADEQLWDTVIETNLKAMWLVAKHVLPVMVDQGGGSIVMISSIGALRGGTSAVYGISKAGVSRLVTSIAATYAAHNIRANAILPGLIDTPMAVEAAIAKMGVTREELVSQRDAKTPMAYKGSAWDVALAALFFASDESRFVSGAQLAVDGAVTASR